MVGVSDRDRPWGAGAGVVALRTTFLVLTLAGCASAPPAVTPTAQSSPTASPMASTTPPPTATPEPPTATPTGSPNRPTPGANPFAGEAAWVAYQSNRGVNGEGTFLVRADGTDDHQVAADFGGALILPDWSPDGTRLVTTARDTGAEEPLFEIDLATDTYRQLFECTDPCLGDDEPAYSPDGLRVAFERAFGPFTPTGPTDCGLWIGEIATGEVVQVTSNTDPPCDREYFPRWSPDGTLLTYWRELFANDQFVGTAVFTINDDGTDETRLTDPAMVAGEPDWSPDGEWIVFATYPLNSFNFEAKVSNLYRMHPDGSGLEQLTHYGVDQLRATQPRYTPDGKWIVFTAVIPETGYDRGQAFRHLWAIPAGGGDAVLIAGDERIYTHGTWQP